ncbi:glycoside hydrolase family 88/105 protein [Chondrinema litorale]|uniref:glycoside hydrolase family 88/105 protein n=1 Tax=Chondrinema litorale TaxID=2994555 RepID=UPI002543DA5C|nr:glycoside hydrolase family 88 protein [Chondrinema litorale]UZR98426.1 glycoside hydrolase family 88 protein [Chondrinema litorale]
MNIKLNVYFIFTLILLFGSCSTSTKNEEQTSDEVTKEKVIEALSKVNDKWQAEHKIEDQNAFWHYTTYHIGNLAAYETTKNKKYLDYTLDWAKHNNWQGAKSTNREEWKFSYGETDEYVLFGDWQACFQVYIDLYNLDPEEAKVARAKEVMDYQVHTDENTYWWWIDGLFMVMPVMTRMYGLTQDSLYLDKLYQYYSYTKEEVYDKETGLFYRDAKYIYPKHQTNSGKKDFWSRGNGWVFAAIARTLDGLPKSDSHYQDYVDIFTKMAETLKDKQQAEGYWTRSLFDPEQAPGPETSGTTFFTYGMLWGINNGLLDKSAYAPIVEKSWEYIAETAIQDDGTLGYVQPIGENAMPGQIVDNNSTSDFGVGAFLLASTEMIRYIDNK